MSVDANTVQLLADVAHRLRIHSIDATSASNSGYILFVLNLKWAKSIYYVNE